MLQGLDLRKSVILVHTSEIESMVKALLKASLKEHVASVVLALASLEFAPNA